MADFAERQIGELSGGQFPKSIDRSHITARSGIHFFLDEPFVGIDAMSEAIIVGLLREFRQQGKTIYCSS